MTPNQKITCIVSFQILVSRLVCKYNQLLLHIVVFVLLRLAAYTSYATTVFQRKHVEGVAIWKSDEVDAGPSGHLGSMPELG